MRIELFIVSAFLDLCHSNSAHAQKNDTPIDTWVTLSDYPSEAIKNGQQGFVNVQYKIGPDGSVSNCKVVYANAPKNLVNITCAAIKERARYLPAYSRKGNAVIGQDTVIVRWLLNPTTVRVERNFGGSVPLNNPSIWATDLDYNRDVAAIGKTDVGIEFNISANGRISTCRTYESSGSEKVDQYTCALVANRARFIQPFDDKGNPMTTVGKTVVHWQKPSF